MPYKAYRDVNKTKEIESSKTTLADVGGQFYCKNENCKALMSVVNGGDSERAFFRRKANGPAHISNFCSADGYFDPTEYEESKFHPDNIFEKIINPANNTGANIRKGTTTATGGGGKKAISTVRKIYYMCRKYDIYNGYFSDDILVDERNFHRYQNRIEGNQLVQCTPYCKVYKKLEYKMNYPSYPYKNGKLLKLKFATEALFWEYYNKFKNKKPNSFVVILGNWQECDSDEFIAECVINKTRQIYFLEI